MTEDTKFTNRQPRPITDELTLRLDRWASLLRNEWQARNDVGEDAAEALDELSTLLTEAANLIASTPRKP